MRCTQKIWSGLGRTSKQAMLLTVALCIGADTAIAKRIYEPYMRVLKGPLPITLENPNLKSKLGQRVPLFQDSDHTYIALMETPLHGRTLVAFPKKTEKGKATGWVTQDNELVFATSITSQQGTVLLREDEVLSIKRLKGSTFFVEITRLGQTAILRVPEATKHIDIRWKEYKELLAKEQKAKRAKAKSLITKKEKEEYARLKAEQRIQQELEQQAKLEEKRRQEELRAEQARQQREEERKKIELEQKKQARLEQAIQEKREEKQRLREAEERKARLEKERRLELERQKKAQREEERHLREVELEAARLELAKQKQLAEIEKVKLERAKQEKQAEVEIARIEAEKKLKLELEEQARIERLQQQERRERAEREREAEATKKRRQEEEQRKQQEEAQRIKKEQMRLKQVFSLQLDREAQARIVNAQQSETLSPQTTFLKSSQASPSTSISIREGAQRVAHAKQQQIEEQQQIKSAEAEKIKYEEEEKRAQELAEAKRIEQDKIQQRKYKAQVRNERARKKQEKLNREREIQAKLQQEKIQKLKAEQELKKVRQAALLLVREEMGRIHKAQRHNARTLDSFEKERPAVKLPPISKKVMASLLTTPRINLSPTSEDKPNPIIDFTNPLSVTALILGLVIPLGSLAFLAQLQRKKQRHETLLSLQAEANQAFEASGVLLRPQHDHADMSGSLKGFSVSDLVQFLNGSKETGVLAISNLEGVTEAKIHFEQGEIIHAKLGNFSGDEAVYAAIGYMEGMFAFSRKEEMHEERTVEQNTMSLLMEGARLCDEKQSQTAKETGDKEGQDGPDIFQRLT